MYMISNTIIGFKIEQIKCTKCAQIQFPANAGHGL